MRSEGGRPQGDASAGGVVGAWQHRPVPTEETAPRPVWREALDGYLLPAPGASGTVSLPTALGLQFELRELIARTTYRWNGPTSKAVTGRSRKDDEPGSGEYRLGVRPVTRTGKGWARGGLTWSNLPHKQRQLELDPAQHRWFSQFVALHRAGVAATPGQDLDWVFLDEFANPVLWALLAQAKELDVPFVGSGGAGVDVAGTASLALDLVRVRRRAADGALPHDRRGARRGAPRGCDRDARGAPLRSGGAAVPRAGRARRAARRRAAAAAEGARGRDPRWSCPRRARPSSSATTCPSCGSASRSAAATARSLCPRRRRPALVLTAAFAPGHVLRLSWAWERMRRGADRAGARGGAAAGPAAGGAGSARRDRAPSRMR